MEKLIKERYEILKSVGLGDISEVLIALNIQTGQTFPVKIMNKRLLSDISFIGHFKRKISIGKALHHPKIPELIDYGDIDGIPFIVMEYIQGVTLTEYINKGPLPLKEAVNIILQVLSALSYAYSRDIQVHRDIKPGNIMIDLKTNTVKIMDFGIVKTIGSSLTHPIALYTPRYASHEQLLPTKFGNRTDERTDIYAIGIVLYEMLVGRLPYSGTTPTEISEKQIKNKISNITSIRSDIPESFSQIIYRYPQANPNNRYKTRGYVFYTTTQWQSLRCEGGCLSLCHRRKLR